MDTRVQKNPYNLVVKQHIFPKKSIDRFTKDGIVSTCFIRQEKVVKVKSNNSIFCANRVWDQGAEQGYMKKIEDDFQSLADDICSGHIKHHFIGHQKETVSKFFALWNIRFYRNINPIPDYKVEGITGVAREINKDEQELIESKGVWFITPILTVPGHQLAGAHIQISIDLLMEQLRNTNWEIIRASEGEFLVPDNALSTKIIPLAPNICLFSPSKNMDFSTSRILSRNEVAILNKQAVKMSYYYYFARDLNTCPVST